MFSEYLQQIEGIASYPLVSLFIFIPFFIIVLFIVFRMRKEHTDYMSNLPLDEYRDSERISL
ncbi:MAG: CcoQ/FixQ family Cbb3-type cytochrome c oxidase assembly chaperone [Ignavibacteriales bacterium]|nr:CcoQ/FixQ family Cbb3-type cytochrome c oxidase assembly chaperone [Ignavibacteriales bacterium]